MSEDSHVTWKELHDELKQIDSKIDKLKWWMVAAVMGSGVIGKLVATTNVVPSVSAWVHAHLA